MKVLVTGGAGFIGANTVLAMLADGHEVVALDDLSRPGAGENLDQVARAAGPGARFTFVRADVADRAPVTGLVHDADAVVHLAAQVSVTGGLGDPGRDFASNALGTFNVLEAARTSPRDPVVLYASTNKVYGGLDRLEPQAAATRWTLPDRPQGIAESEPLDLVTPYACSKGLGDCYALDYARSYGVRTVVVRQSCIYGALQQASEEQAWAAWFIKAALSGRPITIFGDGRQVRDLLDVRDLIAFYRLAIARIDRVAGMAFNVGGGPEATRSIWAEFGPWLERRLGRRVPVRYEPARAGDQRVFVCDIRKAAALLGWRPRIAPAEGLDALFDWIAGQTAGASGPAAPQAPVAEDARPLAARGS